MMRVGNKTWKQIFMGNVAVKCLVLGMFFNPFGFDAVQYYLYTLTGSLMKANLILYCVSGFFFGLYFLFKNRSK